MNPISLIMVVVLLMLLVGLPLPQVGVIHHDYGYAPSLGGLLLVLFIFLLLFR